MKMKNSLQDSWLLSDSIIKRSLSVFGHAFLGQFIIFVPFLLLGIYQSIFLELGYFLILF